MIGRDSSSEFLRGQLASVGILLEDTASKAIATAVEAPVTPAINRGEIRRILAARGAPPKDLRWLTISCPSYEAANTYDPPEDS